MAFGFLSKLGSMFSSPSTTVPSAGMHTTQMGRHMVTLRSDVTIPAIQTVTDTETFTVTSLPSLPSHIIASIRSFTMNPEPAKELIQNALSWYLQQLGELFHNGGNWKTWQTVPIVFLIIIGLTLGMMALGLVLKFLWTRGLKPVINWLFNSPMHHVTALERQVIQLTKNVQMLSEVISHQNSASSTHTADGQSEHSAQKIYHDLASKQAQILENLQQMHKAVEPWEDRIDSLTVQVTQLQKAQEETKAIDIDALVQDASNRSMATISNYIKHQLTLASAGQPSVFSSAVNAITHQITNWTSIDQLRGDMSEMKKFVEEKAAHVDAVMAGIRDNIKDDIKSTTRTAQQKHVDERFQDVVKNTIKEAVDDAFAHQNGEELEDEEFLPHGSIAPRPGDWRRPISRRLPAPEISINSLLSRERRERLRQPTPEQLRIKELEEQIENLKEKIDRHRGEVDEAQKKVKEHLEARETAIKNFQQERNERLKADSKRREAELDLMNTKQARTKDEKDRRRDEAAAKALQKAKELDDFNQRYDEKQQEKNLRRQLEGELSEIQRDLKGTQRRLEREKQTRQDVQKQLEEAQGMVNRKTLEATQADQNLQETKVYFQAREKRLRKEFEKILSQWKSTGAQWRVPHEPIYPDAERDANTQGEIILSKNHSKKKHVHRGKVPAAPVAQIQEPVPASEAAQAPLPADDEDPDPVAAADTLPQSAELHEPDPTQTCSLAQPEGARKLVANRQSGQVQQQEQILQHSPDEQPESVQQTNDGQQPALAEQPAPAQPTVTFPAPALVQHPIPAQESAQPQQPFIVQHQALPAASGQSALQSLEDDELVNSLHKLSIHENTAEREDEGTDRTNTIMLAREGWQKITHDVKLLQEKPVWGCQLGLENHQSAWQRLYEKVRKANDNMGSQMPNFEHRSDIGLLNDLNFLKSLYDELEEARRAIKECEDRCPGVSAENRDQRKNTEAEVRREMDSIEEALGRIRRLQMSCPISNPQHEQLWIQARSTSGGVIKKHEEWVEQFATERQQRGLSRNLEVIDLADHVLIKLKDEMMTLKSSMRGELEPKIKAAEEICAHCGNAAASYQQQSDLEPQGGAGNFDQNSSGAAPNGVAQGVLQVQHHHHQHQQHHLQSQAGNAWSSNANFTDATPNPAFIAISQNQPASDVSASNSDTTAPRQVDSSTLSSMPTHSQPQGAGSTTNAEAAPSGVAQVEPVPAVTQPVVQNQSGDQSEIRIPGITYDDAQPAPDKTEPPQSQKAQHPQQSEQKSAPCPEEQSQISGKEDLDDISDISSIDGDALELLQAELDRERTKDYNKRLSSSFPTQSLFRMVVNNRIVDFKDDYNLKNVVEALGHQQLKCDYEKLIKMDEKQMMRECKRRLNHMRNVRDRMNLLQWNPEDQEEPNWQKHGFDTNDPDCHGVYDELFRVRLLKRDIRRQQKESGREEVDFDALGWPEDHRCTKQALEELAEEKEKAQHDVQFLVECAKKEVFANIMFGKDEWANFDPMGTKYKVAKENREIKDIISTTKIASTNIKNGFDPFLGLLQDQPVVKYVSHRLFLMARYFRDQLKRNVVRDVPRLEGISQDPNWPVLRHANKWVQQEIDAWNIERQRRPQTKLTDIWLCEPPWETAQTIPVAARKVLTPRIKRGSSNKSSVDTTKDEENGGTSGTAPTPFANIGVPSAWRVPSPPPDAPSGSVSTASAPSAPTSTPGPSNSTSSWQHPQFERRTAKGQWWGPRDRNTEQRINMIINRKLEGDVPGGLTDEEFSNVLLKAACEIADLRVNEIRRYVKKQMKLEIPEKKLHWLGWRKSDPHCKLARLLLREEIENEQKDEFLRKIGAIRPKAQTRYFEEDLEDSEGSDSDYVDFRDEEEEDEEASTVSDVDDDDDGPRFSTNPLMHPPPGLETEFEKQDDKPVPSKNPLMGPPPMFKSDENPNPKKPAINPSPIFNPAARGTSGTGTPKIAATYQDNGRAKRVRFDPSPAFIPPEPPKKSSITATASSLQRKVIANNKARTKPISFTLPAAKPGLRTAPALSSSADLNFGGSFQGFGATPAQTSREMQETSNNGFGYVTGMFSQDGRVVYEEVGSKRSYTMTADGKEMFDDGYERQYYGHPDGEARNGTSTYQLWKTSESGWGWLDIKPQGGESNIYPGFVEPGTKRTYTMVVNDLKESKEDFSDHHPRRCVERPDLQDPTHWPENKIQEERAK